METTPLEEQYETDTIFSQEGDISENYLTSKLRDIDEEWSYRNNQNDYNRDYLHLDLPTPTEIENSLNEIVAEGNSYNDPSCSGDCDTRRLVGGEYNIDRNSFHYGRVKDGVGFYTPTEKMSAEVKKIENKDRGLEMFLNKEQSPLFVSTASITLTSEEKDEVNDSISTFMNFYNEQMPRYFEFGQSFPSINDIWTICFDQMDFLKMTTSDIQAPIVAALNSKRYLMICIGIDKYNNVTGVEMSASKRVTFRLSVTRALAGEFQPPLIKVPHVNRHATLPIRQDVSRLTSAIDVLFVPVLKEEHNSSEFSDRRFLIIIRVKEISPVLYQLSSGRIYVEENSQVVELSSLDEALRVLVLNNKKDGDHMGSFFMRESDESSEFLVDSNEVVIEHDVSEDEINTEQSENITQLEVKTVSNVETSVEDKGKLSTKYGRSIEIPRQVSPNAILIMTGLLFAYGIYRGIRGSQ